MCERRVRHLFFFPVLCRIYLIDELSYSNDVTLAVEDGEAEHRLRHEAVAVFKVLAQPRSNVAQVQDLEHEHRIRPIHTICF